MIQGYRPRILVVDDDANVREALGLALSRNGYHVDQAESGTQALQVVADGFFDAAVVDYQMVPCNGIEVLSRLRDLQPRCGRLLISGVLDLPVVLQAVNRGEVSRVIEKPFRLHTMLDALKEVLATRDRLEELSRSAADRSLQLQRSQLEECLASETLSLAMQPIVAAEDGAVRGYEGLLRSSHRELNSVAQVLAAAEAHDAVGRLADRVMVCARHWLEHLPETVSLFLNVHPAELEDEVEVLRRSKVLEPWANRVVLEITERSDVLKMAGWQSTIAYLKGRGFRIAVDDVGAGYNSLAVLAELRPAFIKVDMSITRHIERDEGRQRVLEMLWRYARGTNTQLIAEGIETAEEADTVRRIGADLLQGYLFGRPALVN